jgi:hypothetical protein
MHPVPYGGWDFYRNVVGVYIKFYLIFTFYMTVPLLVDVYNFGTFLFCRCWFYFTIMVVYVIVVLCWKKLGELVGDGESWYI